MEDMIASFLINVGSGLVVYFIIGWWENHNKQK